MIENIISPATARRWLPAILLLLAVLSMSSVPIMTRFVQADDVPSLTIAVLRMAITAVILTPYVLGQSRTELRALRRRDIGIMVLTGLAFALSLVTLFGSLEYTTVLIAILLANVHPILVAVMEVLILGAILSRRVWLGLILALAGMLLFGLAGISGTGDMGPNPLLGAAIALGTALAQAIYFILGRSVRKRVSTAVFMWLVMIFGAILGLAMALGTGTPLLGFSSQSYLLIFLLTITGQVIGQSLLAYCLALLPATFVSISMQGIFVFSSIWAFFIFDERPDLLQLVASAVILSGIITVIAARVPAHPEPASD